MTRFFGLLLMVATGAVVAPLVLLGFHTEGPALGVLAALLAALGLLFGFLATERHLMWGVVASAVIVGSLASHWADPADPRPTGKTLPVEAQRKAYFVSPVVILLFTLLGARLLHRKVQQVRVPAEE